PGAKQERPIAPREPPHTFAAGREAEEAAPGGRFGSSARLNPAICRSDGGGGNRTRVRGRSDQSVYKLRLRFRLARTAGSQPTYRRASHPSVSRLRRLAFLRRLARSWRRYPSHGPDSERRRHLVWARQRVRDRSSHLLG